MRTRAVFPFTAIVGQESIKVALLLNAISPLIGGVLIRGHKGTAKSTAVRALSRLLPDIEVVAGCPFACALSDDPEVCPHCAVHPAMGVVPARRSEDGAAERALTPPGGSLRHAGDVSQGPP